MKIVFVVIVLAALWIGAILGLIGAVSCNGIGIHSPAFADAKCDTTKFLAADIQYIRITCTVTDTLYVQPDYTCIRECLQVHGLGHLETCLQECIDD